ncbi:MAG: DUF2809 domain-containing protein [Pirellulales bacterium]
MALGLASRKFRELLPSFLAEFSGDTLWALMLFLLISAVFASRSILVRAAVSLVIAIAVEVSQLYHAPWIDSIRQTTLGGLVLGFSFLWTDLVCYMAGIVVGSITESAIVRIVRKRSSD